MFRFLIGLLLIATPMLAIGQSSHECGFELDVLSAKAADAAFKSFHASKPLPSELKSQDTLQLPIRFTVFRNDDGSMPEVYGRSSGVVTQQEVDQALSNLNLAYGPLKVRFIQEGPINYVDNSRARLAEVPSHYFSFTSSNSNGYVNWKLPSGVVGKGSRLFSPPSSYNQYGPIGNGVFYIRDSTYLLRPTVVHEMGHVFGLLHTFHGGDELYDNPSDPIENSPQVFADKNTRELVIREEVPADSAPFPVPNYRTAGDRLEDTPAWGRMNSNWPNPNDSDCSEYVGALEGVSRCSSGFFQYDCIYRGNYVDYNGNEFIDTDVSISNFMSYSDSSPSICRTSFTNDQYLLQNSTIRRYAVDIWDGSKGTSFTDSVLFWGSNTPVKDINITLTHAADGPANGRYSQVTTPTDGSFTASLFDEKVKAKLSFLGSGSVNKDYVQSSDTSYNIFHYTDSDWLSGVSTADMILTIKYILGMEEFNSFQMLSADVNRDGEVTIIDALELRKLILGQLSGFEAYSSGPWQFVPEVISASADFATNPFNMSIEGIQYHGEAPYLSSTFEYIPQVGSAAGFSAFKLGDVTGDAQAINNSRSSNISASGCPREADAITFYAYSSESNLDNNVTFQYRLTPTFSGPASGFQGEISFDNTTLELLELLPAAKSEDFGSDNYNVIERGSETVVRFSYTYNKGRSTQTKQLSADEQMLVLRFRTKVAGLDPSQEIELGTGLPLEVYHADGCSLSGEILADVELETESGAVGDPLSSPTDFTLALAPNPARDRANIIINSTDSKHYRVIIYSVTTGREFKQWEARTIDGYYRQEIDISDLPNDVFLVKVTDSQKSQSLKLIKI
ncbi:dockerin type I domain-containing protein [Neolewinella agarilytica]|uniref:Por secretion system C-terminal sorting domain-containing protein n=1 Tax=Neolewinella agarilytica TaxID=478744 RepID=A0A1H9AQT5_9BACT|nr:dockerin type I domain-containing protein [Neolewinella agarilytica]SEP78278.1 Por secretion system C-terminal sorting domain-containing protein [Neolewinella agarilytica]